MNAMIEINDSNFGLEVLPLDQPILMETNRRFTNQVRSPRVRLTPARLSRQHHPPAAKLKTEISRRPAIKVSPETEVAPLESLRGDTLQLYLREINQVRLLTPAEEIGLAKRMRRNDMKAREQMITANLRLVVKIAHEYEGLGLPLLDLINEGNLGLMKGVERFNPSKGAKFSTYGSLWIKQAIRRALSNQSKTIRLPNHVVEKLTHMRRAEARLHEALNREPTDDELAADLGTDAGRIRRYRQASRTPVSLDSPISSDDSTAISEIVPDANAADPLHELIKNTDHELLREVLATLNARESRILTMRFGLDNGRPKTLEAVGEKLGVTRERIRQIQRQALRKMRVRIEKRDRPAVMTVA